MPLSNYQRKQCEKFIKNVAKLIVDFHDLNTVIYYSKFHYEKDECKKYTEILSEMFKRNIVFESKLPTKKYNDVLIGCFKLRNTKVMLKIREFLGLY